MSEALPKFSIEEIAEELSALQMKFAYAETGEQVAELCLQEKQLCELAASLGGL